MKHIDDWVKEPAKNDHEAKTKRWFQHFRLSTLRRNHQYLYGSVVTCTYKKKLYRCVGASRLGDVWLSEDLEKHYGYDLRVDVEECSNWHFREEG